ncbi:DnaJ subfamily B member 2 [Grifola frondosa]|uniref:DnaJ subfamily B member 2 n=1 Tax=Grifola frondosa TaxID=5627 RepID=A0A1C7MBT0_GRIFR|nr:DnaJ subfamily B member 2 [Grifola frondosa]
MGHMAGSRSLYDILGIPRDASADAVRKAYKVKALQTHPDKLPPGARPSEVDAAQARFRDVCTAYDVLNDPAKRRVYDNGLNFVLQRVSTADFQAKLSRERAEWARQAELRHDERLRVLREEIRSSQNRYKANMEQAELKYQEKMRALEERLKSEREQSCRRRR